MPVILETKNLTKTFGGLRAVDEVGFHLEDDELRCIIGPNGCGKTTFFNLITGYYKPDSGQVIFRGKEIHHKSVHSISRMGIGRKFQVPSVFNRLTVYENISVPLFSQRHHSMFFGRCDDKNARQEIMEILAKINLTDKFDDLAMNLSHGENQWLEIGMVLASRPKLMLLDEPTAGMTMMETQKTAQLIRNISQETGISILVIEHDISFVKEIASRITVMYKGRIIREGCYEEIQADEEIREIYLGRPKE